MNTQNARSGKNARTLQAIRRNVKRTLNETKYADARKTIYAKRNTLHDTRTLKRTLKCKQNENVSKPLLKYRNHIKYLTTLATCVYRLAIARNVELKCTQPSTKIIIFCFSLN
jgi:hypothetical protein